MQNRELGKTFFSDLEWINARPASFEFCTTSDLWTDEYVSAQMLSFHLNPDVDLSSRKIAFIDRSVDWLVSHFDIKSGVRVIDFGCGPGLYTSRLAQRGADVTGVDFSARSLEYARKEAERLGLNIRYVNQNYLDFTTDEQFDLLLMIMCDFCAMSPAQRRIMLTKFQSLLKPGGRIVFDAYSLSAFDQFAERSFYEFSPSNGFWLAEPYYEFLNTFKYEEEKVTLDKYTIVGRTQTKDIYNWLQYFSIESLSQELCEAGLAIAELYADVAGKVYEPEANEFAVVVSKLRE